MHPSAVQALLVVLDDDLPVGRDLGNGAHADAQVGQTEALEPDELLAVLYDPGLERRGFLGQADEHEALPHVRRHRPQRQRVLVDVVVAEVRCGDESAVECVRPRVVRAHERALRAVAALVAQARATMAADVGERVEDAVEVAGDQDALAGDVDHRAIASGQRVGAHRHEPPTVEEPLSLDLVDRVGCVVGTGEGAVCG